MMRHFQLPKLLQGVGAFLFTEYLYYTFVTFVETGKWRLKVYKGGICHAVSESLGSKLVPDMNGCIKQKFCFGNLATKNLNIKFILIYRLAVTETVDLILPLHFKGSNQYMKKLR